ncbi:41919_t:CDS:1 [Gigaspora margarita]|uniref:41919_t:CDS:1 n=1 Tax=Gigaspora margarita TaxID=4874 RepID=A0ABN7WEM4_GIGMA|nr:41919_t:CDS:1 [Gigaspora margarita]
MFIPKIRISDSDLEKTSQTENSQEIDPISKVSQSESSQITKQTLQDTPKKNKHHHRLDKLVAKCWKYFKVESEQSVCKIKLKIKMERKNFVEQHINTYMVG